MLTQLLIKKMAVQQQLGDYNHCKCPFPYQRKTLSQLNPTLRVLSKSQNWLAGPWLDLGWTGHFDNETELLQRVLAEKSSPSCLTDTLL